MSPGRARSPERLAAENVKLKADLATSQEVYDREVAQRMREEAERTLSRVEELWRVSQENDKLKADLAAAHADAQRELVQAEVLRQALASVDDAVGAREAERAAMRAELVAAKSEVGKLEHALACLNRHATGLCNACGNLYRHPGVKLQTASYRSRSPRFGKSADHAMCGTKSGANAALSAEKLLPGPGAHHPRRDHYGSFVTTSYRSSLEPYSVNSADVIAGAPSPVGAQSPQPPARREAVSIE